MDGGGSKTDLYLSDGSGRILFSVTVGPTSFKSVGSEQAVINLKTGLDLIRAKNRAKGDYVFCVFGMSGCDTPKDYEIYHQILHSLGFQRHRYLLCNDSVLAFYAKKRPPGIVIVAGTGAIAYGIGNHMQTFRLGGWGYGFSDLGGGYWIGNEVLKETLLYCDGCREYDGLFEAVLKKIKADSFENLSGLIADIANPSEVADFTRLAMDCNSVLSEKIVESAADWICRLGSAMYNKMGRPINPNFVVVLAGSLFENERFHRCFLRQFCENTGLDDKCITRLDLPPATGGINMALDYLNGALNISFS